MEATPTKRGGLLLLIFVFGVALGVAGTILVGRSVGPDLLSRFRSNDPVEGHVLDKALESDRLLLKIETEHGAFLATFSERQAETDLLVDPGDAITLDVEAYQPFLADPAIERVRKPKPPMESEEPTVDTGIGVEPQITEPQAVEPTAVPQETETPA